MHPVSNLQFSLSEIAKLSSERFISTNTVVYISINQFLCQPLILHHCKLPDKFLMLYEVSKENIKLHFVLSAWFPGFLACMQVESKDIVLIRKKGNISFDIQIHQGVKDFNSEGHQTW